MPTAEITRLERNLVETSSFADLLPNLTQKERLLSMKAVVSRPESVPRTVHMIARGEVVGFKYLDNGDPRPTWFEPVLQGFANVATLADGWDGSGALRIDRATINRALGT